MKSLVNATAVKGVEELQERMENAVVTIRRENLYSFVLTIMEAILTCSINELPISCKVFYTLFFRLKLS